MRMAEIVELIDTETTPNEAGVAVKTETRREVYADKQSVRRQEHYAANAAGQTVDVIFEVMADEYNEEAELQHRERRYKIVRAYSDRRGRVQLTCQIK